MEHRLRQVAGLIHDARVLGVPFLIENLRSRFNPRGETVVNVDSFRNLHVRRSTDDIAVIRQVIGYRAYDMSDVKHAESTLEQRYQAILAEGKVPVIVDAGANIGAASLWFKHRFPRATVVAIEPDPENVRILQRNLASHEGMIALPAAIGATSGFVEMSSGHSSVGGTTTRAESGIRVVTIQDALAEVENGVLFIAKIDIEGFESDLFAQNCGWIDEACSVMIEPHDWMIPGKKTSHSFQAAMAGRGFDLFIKGDNLIYVRS